MEKPANKWPQQQQQQQQQQPKQEPFDINILYFYLRQNLHCEFGPLNWQVWNAQNETLKIGPLKHQKKKVELF